MFTTGLIFQCANQRLCGYNARQTVAMLSRVRGLVFPITEIVKFLAYLSSSANTAVDSSLNSV